MAKFVVSESRNAIDGLDPKTVTDILRKCVLAGAKVVEKEMKSTIESRGHVVNGWMRDSVAAGVLHEDIDAVWIEVYPQGYDPRGVDNAMKNKVINDGFYNRNTGRKVKRDPFIKRMQKDIEPKIRAVMDYQYDLCMKEIHGG